MFMLLFFIMSIVNAQETKPTLVILQIEKQRETYKTFIEMIKTQRENVEVVEMDAQITFESYGEFNYHSVYILAPKYNFKQMSRVIPKK